MKIRTRKRICVAVGLTLFLLTLGIVGGMDLGKHPLLARRCSGVRLRADSGMRLVQGRGVPA
jgi:hypothetical protein